MRLAAGSRHSGSTTVGRNPRHDLDPGNRPFTRICHEEDEAPEKKYAAYVGARHRLTCAKVSLGFTMRWVSRGELQAQEHETCWNTLQEAGTRLIMFPGIRPQFSGDSCYTLKGSALNEERTTG